MNASHRYDKIIEIVNERGGADTKELALLFNVTETTIRRDCEALEQQGALRRVHGGVKSLKNTALISTHDEKEMGERTEHIKEKDTVCRYAASYVNDGDCIFLDGGTSIAPILKYISGKSVKIVTHSGLVADIFQSDTMELFMLGGKYIPKYNMSVGPMTLENIHRFHFDIAFIGCLGVDPLRETLFTTEMETMEIKRIAMRQSTKRLLLLDSSKLFIRGFYSSISTKEFDVVLCNRSSDIDMADLPGNYQIIDE